MVYAPIDLSVLHLYYHRLALHHWVIPKHTYFVLRSLPLSSSKAIKETQDLIKRSLS